MVRIAEIDTLIAVGFVRQLDYGTSRIECLQPSLWILSWVILEADESIPPRSILERVANKRE